MSEADKVEVLKRYCTNCYYNKDCKELCSVVQYALCYEERLKEDAEIEVG